MGFQDVGLRSMGTQVHQKDYFPGYYSMRDLNGDGSSSNWPLYYGDRALTNGQYCNSFISRSIPDANSGYEKDVVKQRMIEHEVVFKNQVSELHRVYRIQRDMMGDAKRNEPSSSSTILGTQMDARKWDPPFFSFANSGYARTAVSSTGFINSEYRPSKVRKKLFDLELPPADYIDLEEEEEEEEHLHDPKEHTRISKFLDGHEAVDLNEPAPLEDAKSSIVTAKPKPTKYLDLNEAVCEEDEELLDTIVSSAEGKLRNGKKKLMIDINVACGLSDDESDEPTAKRHVFDLNSCITEEDDAFGPAGTSNNIVKTGTVFEIDLEAPVVWDSEEDNHDESSLQLSEQKDDEAARNAAEAMVALCAPPEDPFAETLSWFADVISSCRVPREPDYFEMMTLQLTETKEEDYMPKPFVLENVEDRDRESAPTRPRRCPARRGRQRRDYFQKDILPSLASLSRYEISEDFHTFGRLMSPRGSKLSRRNGARGRRRAEAAVVSGWGKTTRRPPRQRCPPPLPSNP